MKSYNKFYYDKNKKKISVTRQIKRTNKYFDFDGHLEPIHDSIRRYSKQWGIPIDPFKKFKSWAKNDPTYEELFQAWEAAGFAKELTPVVMRRVKKKGFVNSNLYWSTKNKHSWWNGELARLKVLNVEMNERQAKNNEMTEAEKINVIGKFKRLKK